MKMTQKFAAVMLPLGVIMAAPYAAAQTAPAEPTQVTPVQIVKVAEHKYEEGIVAPRWRDKEVALSGRDVVSYSQDSGPVEGKKEYAAEFDDTKWYFKTKENRDAFKANPNKYVPEFGGYCPVALSRGIIKVGQTNQFTRHEGKLYMNYNEKNRDTFAVDPKSYILKARTTW